MKKWIKYGLVIAGLLIGIIYYITTYDVTEENLTKEIEAYLDQENVEIIDEEDLAKDRVVHFKSSTGHGVIKLEEGLFKSRIANGYYTEDQVGMVRYNIGRKDYFLTYAYVNENQTIRLHYKLEQKTFEDNHVCIINGVYGFPDELVLVDQSNESVIQLNYETQNQFRRSSGPKGFVEFNTGLIVIVFFIISIPFSLKFKTFEHNVQMDGQRIKQFRRY